MKRTGFVIVVCVSVVCLNGCEAFARKFTREPKDKTAAFDVVLAPQQYADTGLPVEDQARQLYVFWKSWHTELVSALETAQGYKRKVQCANEAVSSLRRFADLARDEYSQKARAYADELDSLKGLVEKDTMGMRNSVNAQRAARLLGRIERDFRYSRIADYLRQ